MIARVIGQPTSRGYELFEVEETGQQIWWARCDVAGCGNCVCTWRSDRYCHPHAKALEPDDA